MPAVPALSLLLLAHVSLGLQFRQLAHLAVEAAQLGCLSHVGSQVDVINPVSISCHNLSPCLLLFSLRRSK
jgi:hypothetical protein